MFWVQENRERKKTKIINSLMKVVKEIMSIEDLNLLAIPYVPIMQKDKGIRKEVEL